MKSILAQKIGMTRDFDEKGRVVPLTELKLDSCLVSGERTVEKHGYRAYQLAFGNKMRKNLSKGQQKRKESLGGKILPIFLREFRLNESEEGPAVGQEIKAEEIFQAGDLVSVSAVSKGKGFAGGVKRHGFKGGPRTHGQSDRERAPGSIGQTTTPGRVYKGKRMAGHLGNSQVTTRNLKIFKIDTERGVLSLVGSVPGRRNTLVKVVSL